MPDLSTPSPTPAASPSPNPSATPSPSPNPSATPNPSPNPSATPVPKRTSAASQPRESAIRAQNGTNANANTGSHLGPGPVRYGSDEEVVSQHGLDPAPVGENLSDVFAEALAEEKP